MAIIKILGNDMSVGILLYVGHFKREYSVDKADITL